MAKSQTYLVRLLRQFIGVYQLQSPLWGPRCRFYPSCSEYMREALAVEGLWRGLWLGLRRLSKCHPWNAGGVDLVRKSYAK